MPGDTWVVMTGVGDYGHLLGGAQGRAEHLMVHRTATISVPKCEQCGEIEKPAPSELLSDLLAREGLEPEASAL